MSVPLIAKTDKTRVVNEWSNPAYGIDGLPTKPPADYGDMGGFLRTLTPGAFMAGMDFKTVSFTGWCRPCVDTSRSRATRRPDGSACIFSCPSAWAHCLVGTTSV